MKISNSTNVKMKFFSLPLYLLKTLKSKSNSKISEKLRNEKKKPKTTEEDG